MIGKWMEFISFLLVGFVDMTSEVFEINDPVEVFGKVLVQETSGL